MSEGLALSIRAEAILGVVESALEEPDNEQLYYDYHCALDPAYSLELRSHSGPRYHDVVTPIRYL